MAVESRFGPLLARYRQERGLSMGALGRQSGMTLSMISRLEHGTRNPSLPTVRKLGAVLALSPLDNAMLYSAAGFVPDEQWRRPLPYWFERLTVLMADAELPNDIRELIEEQARTTVHLVTRDPAATNPKDYIVRPLVERMTY